MISILIPVFNFDVRQLVSDLKDQCMAAGIEFEVLCFDDGSEEVFKNLNRTVASPNVVYKEMPENMGRSAIRNELGKAANFPYLLFMDCDSKVVRADFIQKYFNQLSDNSLLYGGRCYHPYPPNDPQLFFHWKYGTHREQATVGQRRQQPWHSFMTNNFLLPKSVFEKNYFDESLKQYGHEDTLFGLQLADKKILIVHLDNPLEHMGLETAGVFLEKTNLGLQNLHALWKRGTPIETKLLAYFTKIKKWQLVGFVALIFKMASPFLKRNLFSKNPSLIVFDIYKLGYLCHLDQKR